MANRNDEVERFYELLEINENRNRLCELGHLDSLKFNLELREAGIYFFFEPGQQRRNSKDRVVRVGITKSRCLWDRLVQHLLCSDQSSFFNLLWSALAHRERRDNFNKFLGSYWRDIPEPPKREMLEFENGVVRDYKAKMTFSWVPSKDPLLSEEIERSATVLLSNYKQKELIDPPKGKWLGMFHPERKVRESGLWSTKLYLDHNPSKVWLRELEQIVMN
jgi:hypothetical protein